MSFLSVISWRKQDMLNEMMLSLSGTRPTSLVLAH
jgi:hypothetical protein